MVGWALDRLRQARDTGDEAASRELEALFDELTLRRCLEEPRGFRLSQLFMDLRAEAFVPVAALLLTRWPALQGSAAYWAAPVLARIEPEKLLHELESHLESPDTQWTSDMVRGAVKAASIIGKPAQELASGLLALIGDGDDDLSPPLVGTLTAMLVNTGSPEQERLLA